MSERVSRAGAGGIPIAGTSLHVVTGWRILLAVVVLPASLFARRIDITTMPVSSYADTEVSTNVVLRTADVNVHKLSLRIQLNGTPTNNFELAFGCDANTNGVLNVEEIDVVYGWRAGRYFIENVREWDRIETENVGSPRPCVFEIGLKNSREMTPVQFTANCGIPFAFADLTALPPPPWLYHGEWNMVRATRRGAGVPSGWIHCETGNNPFVLTVK